MRIFLSLPTISIWKGKCYRNSDEFSRVDKIGLVGEDDML